MREGKSDQAPMSPELADGGTRVFDYLIVGRVSQAA